MKTKLLALAIICLQFNLSAQLIESFIPQDSLSVGPGTAGYSFTIGPAPLSIFTLGVWDDSGSGLTASHTVGIWDTTPAHNLLAQAIVAPSTSTDLNGFWYVNLVTPLVLAPHTTYVIGAQYADVDLDLAQGNVASVITASDVTLGDALLSSGINFTFPDLNVSGANLGFFGPNAGFESVPEPERYAVVAAAALLIWGIATTATRKEKYAPKNNHC